MAVLTEAVIDIASATTTILVAAASGRIVKVYRLIVFANGANTLTWQDSGAAVLYPAMAFAANSGLVLDEYGYPWMTTPAGLGLSLVTSAAAQVSGRVYYSQA